MKNILQRIPLFEAANLDLLERHRLNWSSHSYNVGDTLMTPGEQENNVFFLLQGKVRLTLLTSEGDITSYREILPYDYFGWLSAIDDGERLTSAIALQSCKVLKLKAEEFRHIILSDPIIYDNFLRRVGGVLRNYTKRIQELSVLSAHQRIIQELVRQFKELNEPINLPSHEDFATWTGTARETVTRTLKILERNGYIQKDGTSYRLLKDLDFGNDWLC